MAESAWERHQRILKQTKATQEAQRARNRAREAEMRASGQGGLATPLPAPPPTPTPPPQGGLNPMGTGPVASEAAAPAPTQTPAPRDSLQDYFDAVDSGNAGAIKGSIDAFGSAANPDAKAQVDALLGGGASFDSILSDLGGQFRGDQQANARKIFEDQGADAARSYLQGLRPPPETQTNTQPQPQAPPPNQPPGMPPPLPPPPPPPPPATGPVGVQTPTAAPTAGVGEPVMEQSRQASSVGFDDPAVRESQQELVRRILGESEELGREATNNLQMPETTRSPLEGTVESFLQQQLQSGLTGDDPITQSLLADFDAQRERARGQQIEDLQRFGVLGDEVSAGGVADVLGTFNADSLRGRGATKAQGIQQMLQSILPQATGFVDAQAGRAQQQSQFEAGYNLDRLGMQQDVADRSLNRRLALTAPTETQRFQEGVRQQNEQLSQQDRQFLESLGLQRAELTGQIIDPVTGRPGQTLAARNARENRALERERLAQQGSQFDAGLDLERAGLTGQVIDPVTGRPGQTLAARQLSQQGNQFDRQLSQQDRQFLASLGIDEDRLDLQRADVTGQFIDPVTGRPAQTLGARQLSQQDRQFLASLGLDRERLTQQDEQFDESLGEQRLSRLTQNRQFAQQLSQQDRQFLASLGLDQDRLGLQQAEVTGQFIDPVTGRPAQTLGARQLAQQGGQFDRSLAEQVAGRTQQGDQFDRSLEAQIAELLGQTPGGRDTLQARQIARQNERDNLAAILTASEAGLANDTDASRAVQQFLRNLGIQTNPDDGAYRGTRDTGTVPDGFRMDVLPAFPQLSEEQSQAAQDAIARGDWEEWSRIVMGQGATA